MLSFDDNSFLTDTNRGTPMGDLLRRYWIPVLLSEELPEPGCPPVRAQVLGERLVAVRDVSGRLALLQEGCPHRRVSLFFARNEGPDAPDGAPGLRCVYHGWKYDLSGNCIDMPNEPKTSRFKDHIQITAYPAQERGGVIWVYMGPAESQPALPELEWAMVPDAQRFVSKRLQFTNFAQAMEGGIDSSHVSFLHSDAGLWNPDRAQRDTGSLSTGLLQDTAPRFFIEPTDYGFLIGARRQSGPSNYYWRITQWLMPWYTFIPRDADGPIGAHAWVPIDNESCFAFSVSYHPDRPLTSQETNSFRHGGSIHAVVDEETFVPLQRASNNYRIDRVLQSTVSWSGIPGIAMEDVAMQESMGTVVDRTDEHLGSSDAAIVAARRRLIGEARALAGGADSPSGLDPASQRVRSGSAVLPADAESWVDATAEIRAADSRYYANS
jgi:phenylpropionate dioxygenase-like ring-hydroxylating dioxygenase large terminal subunit